jgi:UrcA family protein
LAVTGLIISSSAVTARANDMDSNSIGVTARDLDLRTTRGAATLRHRVIIAAYKVCERGDMANPFASDAFRDCVREAVHNVSHEVETLISAEQGANQIASVPPTSR